MSKDQHKIRWEGSVPVSLQFDDPFYSLKDGLAETRYVFLEGNRLPERFEAGFHVAELGFGTGLNFLVCLQAWRASGVKGKLRFTSFEAYPMRVVDMLAALAPFPDLPKSMIEDDDDLDILSPHITGPDFELVIVRGDVRDTLVQWDGLADAWFLDGFAPAKNPDMWGEGVMTAVARHTAPGGTFATYTAVGEVRRGLAAAGFLVDRIKGFGAKRHMTRGVLP